MKNEDKYKTPEEREAAYHRFCTGHKTCDWCPLHENMTSRCAFAWLSAEYKGEEAPFEVVFGNTCASLCRSDTKEVITSWDYPPMYDNLVIDSKEVGPMEVMRGKLQPMCEALNEAALAWHKRMVEKESE